MKLKKILISILFAFTMCFVSTSTVFATEKDLDTLGGELVYYYMQGNCETDVLRTLDAIKALDEEAYDTWSKVMDYWSYVDNDMVEYTDIAPDGLPNTNKHAFVVLGYALNNDGTMQDELKGRLQVAYDSAMKYPNTYVLVTGGGTAKDNPTVTEGDSSYDYLVNTLGLDSSRVLVENTSKNTVQNATNSYNILKNQGINSITLISSQYHLKRGCLLFYSEFTLMEQENGYHIDMIKNVGWLRSDKTTEGVSMEGSSLAQLMGVSIPGQARPGQAPTTPAPASSVLESITLKGKTVYTVGDTLDLKTTATYDIDDYTRDVSSLVTLTGYDLTKPGKQIVSVTYKENGVEKSTTTTITVNEAAPVLSSLEVTGNREYAKGNKLSLNVFAIYDNGDKVDVTTKAIITGFDANKIGKQTIKISYQENGVLKESTIEISVYDREKVTSPDTSDDNVSDIYTLISTSSLAILFILKKRYA